MTKKPKGGKGSNQYQTRGQSQSGTGAQIPVAPDLMAMTAGLPPTLPSTPPLTSDTYSRDLDDSIDGEPWPEEWENIVSPRFDGRAKIIDDQGGEWVGITKQHRYPGAHSEKYEITHTACDAEGDEFVVDVDYADTLTTAVAVADSEANWNKPLCTDQRRR